MCDKAKASSRMTAAAGFCAAEVLLLMVFLASTISILGRGVLTTHEMLRAHEVDARGMDQAEVLMARIGNLPFGSTPTTPSAEQIGALVALLPRPGETIPTATGGPPSLLDLELVSPLTWTYTTNTLGPAATLWSVRLDRDLDGDGSVSGFETNPGILRIEILRNGQMLLRRIRSRGVGE